MQNRCCYISTTFLNESLVVFFESDNETITWINRSNHYVTVTLYKDAS